MPEDTQFHGARQPLHVFEIGSSDNGEEAYKDVPGFCKSALLDDVRHYDYVLAPGRYVDIELQEEDDEPFEDKMRRLAAEWHQQVAEARRLDVAIEANLTKLGFPSLPTGAQE